MMRRTPSTKWTDELMNDAQIVVDEVDNLPLELPPKYKKAKWYDPEKEFVYCISSTPCTQPDIEVRYAK